MKEPETKLPSTLQVGDDVELNFLQSGILKNCIVKAVKITEDKITYDILVCTKGCAEAENLECATIIKNIDSIFVSKATFIRRFRIKKELLEELFQKHRLN